MLYEHPKKFTMIRQWFFRKQCVQHEGLYVAIQYIIHQKQISRNKVAKRRTNAKKKKKQGHLKKNKKKINKVTTSWKKRLKASKTG